MNGYTPKQQEYINSVDGDAHMSAVEIIGELEECHNALVEAVEWERECIRQLDYAGRFWEDDNIPGRELIKFLDAARAEVDRLIASEGAADCEGEG